MEVEILFKEKTKHNPHKPKKIKVRQTINKFKNNIKKFKIEKFGKCVILIILFLYFKNITQYLSFFNLKNINYIDINQKSIINDKKLNEIIWKNKSINEIENLDLKRSIKCIPNNGKIYWNNEKDLEIAKLIKLVKASNKYNILFENENDFYKRENPSVSIIITIYNQERFINKSYAFIQNQELKDIEIIYVDDASTDNSSSIIKHLMEKDKRIVYIKNDINRKQYYSINIGVLNAKGEYILSIDPDDLLLNNILIKVYKTARKYDLDILQFYMIIGTMHNLHLWKVVKYKSGIMCKNTEIRKIFYYGKSRNLPDKLIKRNIYLKSISFMPKELYYEDYQEHTDDTSFFGIVHFAQTYGFLEQIGYFYNNDPGRKTNIEGKANRKMRSYFNIMKYFLIKSDNNINEKILMPYNFFYKKVRNQCKKFINKLTEGFEFYFEVLDLYLNCTYFNEEKKKEIRNYKNILIQRENFVKLRKK